VSNERCDESGFATFQLLSTKPKPGYSLQLTDRGSSLGNCMVKLLTDRAPGVLGCGVKT
jgi:hypothetical protein